MPRSYWVYILASEIGGTLMTNDLIRRVYAHRTHDISGFTSKYYVHRLVYFEQFDDATTAIRREKAPKEMEQGMEDQPHRGVQSSLARSVPDDWLKRPLRRHRPRRRAIQQPAAEVVLTPQAAEHWMPRLRRA